MTPRSPAHGTRPCAGWLGLLLCLTACAADTGPPPIGDVPVIGVVTELTFPLDAYLLNAEQRTTLQHAEDVLLARCLRRFGFTQQPAPRPPELSSRVRLYGVSDPELVARWGYHVPPQDADPEPERHAAEIAVITGEGEQTYRGVTVPEGGCIGEARRSLAGGLPEDGFVQGLSREAFRRSGEDVRVRTLFHEWSACMKTAGFQYRDPSSAINNPAWQQGAEPTAQEIATAQADVRCRHQLNVHGTWYAVNVAHEHRVIAENADAVASAKDSVARRDRLAKAVTGS